MESLVDIDLSRLPFGHLELPSNASRTDVIREA